MKPRLVMGLVMMAAWPAMGQILGLPVGGGAAVPGEALTVYLEASYLDTTEWIEDVFFAAGARWVY